MPRRLLKLVSKSLSRKPVTHASSHAFTAEDVIWVMGSFCALNRKPFDAGLLLKQFPPPYSSDSFVHAARALGFRIKRRDCDSNELSKFNLPCLVVLNETALVAKSDIKSNEVAEQGATPAEQIAVPIKYHPAIIVQIKDDNVILFEVGTNTPKTMSLPEFSTRFAGTAFQLALETKGIKDPDGALRSQSEFGFRWFIPELLKHKRIWRDVLIASLIIQVLALGTPLFTQVIIDKVVVHHTQSTLIVIGIGLAVFILFRAAVLGAPVPDPAYRQPRRCGAGCGSVRPSVQAAATLLRAQAHRGDRRAFAWRGDHTRIHSQHRRHADPRFSVPADLPRYHVLLQCQPDLHRAGHIERHRHPQPDRRADVPQPPQRTMSGVRFSGRASHLNYAADCCLLA